MRIAACLGLKLTHSQREHAGNNVAVRSANKERQNPIKGKKKCAGCAIFVPFLLLLCVRDTNRSCHNTATLTGLISRFFAKFAFLCKAVCAPAPAPAPALVRRMSYRGVISYASSQVGKASVPRMVCTIHLNG
jgi:hypothetical protein